MYAWMQRHVHFLNEVDTWFSSVRRSHPTQMRCGSGCSLCCYGLFDISLPDALHLAEGIGGLAPDVLGRVKRDAAVIQRVIESHAPGLEAPWLLHGVNESTLDEIVAAARSPRCPLLGEGGECLVYPFRPLACRLEGVPMVDTADGLFGDWCELNFRGGVSPALAEGLKQDYYGLQRTEDVSTEVLAEVLLGIRSPAVTVFIASVIAAHEDFWAPLSRRLHAPQAGQSGPGEE